ncbi:MULTISPECIES: hypothetical protein [unclassified Polynucleobacter]|jgi:PHD/YefM family antitoxin component YafN of YafNO toxin-antitoxin module|uniref:hypothetical protein n=1 Tax=unclassified Polynucleobacter TaxID=2640945 RepID=UPI000BCFECF5|nr:MULTISPECIES: hypothetical protein [unclassified Polynucleobacter]OYY21193.1 MAG: hypothetical protein B7Y67_02770 [Polynucleobacter sp. 35-46-11]OZA76579.1 MAG: hypothetical protein B7X71_07905 [Polynucleobacter sp. 39-46-10]
MPKKLAVKKIPASKLNQDFDGVFDLVKLQPIGLTKNGRITAYLISASAYEALIKNLTSNYQVEGLLNIRAT